jgi:hypothetical protein
MVHPTPSDEKDEGHRRSGNKNSTAKTKRNSLVLERILADA